MLHIRHLLPRRRRRHCCGIPVTGSWQQPPIHAEQSTEGLKFHGLFLAFSFVKANNSVANLWQPPQRAPLSRLSYITTRSSISVS